MFSQYFWLNGMITTHWPKLLKNKMKKKKQKKKFKIKKKNFFVSKIKIDKKFIQNELPKKKKKINL